MKSIPKIVFSGGPCGGKTQAIKYIKEHLEKLGFHVVTVTESAANVLADGFDRNLPTYEFQKAIGIKNLRFADVITDIVALGNKCTVKSNQPYILEINGKVFRISVGEQTISLS